MGQGSSFERYISAEEMPNHFHNHRHRHRHIHFDCSRRRGAPPSPPPPCCTRSPRSFRDFIPCLRPRPDLSTYHPPPGPAPQRRRGDDGWGGGGRRGLLGPGSPPPGPTRGAGGSTKCEFCHNPPMNFSNLCAVCWRERVEPEFEMRRARWW